MLLSQKIRIEVSLEDAATLEFMQGKCRGLYNWWVMKLRDGERWPGWREAKKTLQASKLHDPELKQVYGKLLHEVYFRLEGGMKAFFRRVDAGEKPGFPRVRPRHAFFTLCYPAMYIQIEGDQITLPTGGKGHNKHHPNVVAHLTETPPEHFKEVAISRDARGHYYASFPAEWSAPACETEGVVAFDLGVKTLAAGITEQGCTYTIGGSKGARWYNKQLDQIGRASCRERV